MADKKVLILAYYFPPLGMGGVQRVTKFAKYLPHFGWNPCVLTVKDVEYSAKDPSLLENIPRNVEIIRTGSFDPLRIWFILKNLFRKRDGKDKQKKARSFRRSKFSSWLFFPDNKIGWIPFVLLKGLKLCRSGKVDLIFSSSPPPSSHLTGCMLKLFTGIPWIADFRDPWTGYKMETFPTPFHLFLKKRMERLIVNKADKVITANPAIAGDFKRRFAKVSKIHLIDQGYDEEDFAYLFSSSSENFTIGYLGTFSPDCDPAPFFAGLGEVISQGMIPKQKVRFVHAGLSMGVDLNYIIEKYKLKEVVQQKGYLSHRDSLSEMQKVSLLLLVTSDDPLIFPAKVFEYLRLKKPILAIIPPESEIAKFLTEMKAGKVVSPEDKPGIQRELLFYFRTFTGGELTSDMSEDEINNFERKSLALKLASLLDEVAGR